MATSISNLFTPNAMSTPLSIKKPTSGVLNYSPIPAQDRTRIQALPKPTVPPVSAPIQNAASPQPKPVAQTNTNAPIFNGYNPNSDVPQNAQPTPVKGLFPTVTSSLVSRASQPSDAYTQGLQRYNDINKQISDVGQIGGQVEGAVASKGFMPVATGRAANIANTTIKKQQALATQAQGALQSAGLGQSQQNIELGALNNAANLTKPSGNYPFVFNPETGSFSGGIDDSNALVSDLARQVKSGQMTRAEAESKLGVYGISGTNALNNALGAGFNTTQSNATISGQSNLYQNLPALESAGKQAATIKNLTVQHLVQNPQLNLSDLTAGNKLQKWVQGEQLADPKYQTLMNDLNEYTNTLAPILGVGGGVTNFKTEIAQSFINGSAKGENIIEVMNDIEQLANAKIATAKAAAGGGNYTPTATGGNPDFSW